MRPGRSIVTGILLTWLGKDLEVGNTSFTKGIRSISVETLRQAETLLRKTLPVLIPKLSAPSGELTRVPTQLQVARLRRVDLSTRNLRRIARLTFIPKNTLDLNR